MQQKTSLKEILDKISKLPEVYHIAVKIAKMLDDPNISAKQISNVISLDQALITQIIKLCNSAQYGFSRKIVSINEAVSMLGFKTVKSLVFVAVSRGILNQSIKGYDLAKGELGKAL